MEAEEIYMNQEVKMQAAAFKDKKPGCLAQNKDASDPDYENISLTFRNQGRPNGNHSPPKSQVPAKSRPPSGPAQTPQWLYRAIMSLYILLALTFIFFIILSAVVLVKNAEMSQELLVLKRELWNVSNSVREGQEAQNKGQTHIQWAVDQNKAAISNVNTTIQNGNDKLDTL
ncbi:mast cell-expressed membrane protein 1 [Orycteropus afer afer]|uniref:Mast cell-expressed membrane protein 1 n=1 Tax=Orycteropus afer afer TaxID=1230840 RepID=A0A8B7AWB5_ORYAF|nr:mast cell-expressed membrane protein 1 [Orycteropus afer afer]